MSSSQLYLHLHLSLHLQYKNILQVVIELPSWLPFFPFDLDLSVRVVVLLFYSIFLRFGSVSDMTAVVHPFPDDLFITSCILFSFRCRPTFFSKKDPQKLVSEVVVLLLFCCFIFPLGAFSSLFQSVLPESLAKKEELKRIDMTREKEAK